MRACLLPCVRVLCLWLRVMCAISIMLISSHTPALVTCAGQYKTMHKRARISFLQLITIILQYQTFASSCERVSVFIWKTEAIISTKMFYDQWKAYTDLLMISFVYVFREIYLFLRVYNSSIQPTTAVPGHRQHGCVRVVRVSSGRLRFPSDRWCRPWCPDALLPIRMSRWPSRTSEWRRPFWTDFVALSNQVLPEDVPVSLCKYPFLVLST